MRTGELIRKLQSDMALAPWLPTLEEDWPEGGWLAVAELERADTLTNLLAGFAHAEGFPGGDRRAIASLWSRWHFSAMLPPFVAALLLHRCAPELQAVQLSPGNKTSGVAWRQCAPQFDPGSPGAACELTVWQARPLIDSLAGVSGVSTRVFWNNLGNLLEYLVTELRTHPDACGHVAHALDALLEAPHLSDDSPNPLQRPVRYLPDASAGTRRMRRICCLYYLLPGTELCASCPRTVCKPHHVQT